MKIAAESGLGTTLLGNLMVASRPLATPALLAIPISRLLLRGMRGLAGRMQRRSCGLMVMTGIRLAPQATLTPWHAVLIIVGTLVLALTKNKAGLDHCRCGGAWFRGVRALGAHLISYIGRCSLYIFRYSEVCALRVSRIVQSCPRSRYVACAARRAGSWRSVACSTAPTTGAAVTAGQCGLLAMTKP